MRPREVGSIRPRAIVAIVALFALPLVIFLVLFIIKHGSPSPPEQQVWPDFLIAALCILTVITEIIGIILIGRKIRKTSDLESVRYEIKHFAILAAAFVATSFAMGISVGRLVAHTSFDFAISVGHRLLH